MTNSKSRKTLQKTTKKAYHNTCTRINVTEPSRIVLISNPTQKALRSLATGDWFVNLNGDVLPYPNDFARRKVAGKAAEGREQLDASNFDPNTAWHETLKALDFDITAYTDAINLKLA